MRGIVFITGTGRSGTNLANEMLDSHPRLKLINETHFLRTLVRRPDAHTLDAETYWEVAWEHFTSSGGQRWLAFQVRRAYQNVPTVRERFLQQARAQGLRGTRALTYLLFRQLYGRGNYLLGDKTPTYGLCMSNLLAVFPEAKFLHLIRDGRYTATSMQHHPGFVRMIHAGFPVQQPEYAYQGVLAQYEPAPVSLEQCAGLWAELVSRIRAESQSLPAGVYQEVYYENLITQPVEELTRIAAFLGLGRPRLWMWYAAAIPRPGALYHEKMRLSAEVYTALTRRLGPTLRALGYSEQSHGELVAGLDRQRPPLRRRLNHELQRLAYYARRLPDWLYEKLSGKSSKLSGG